MGLEENYCVGGKHKRKTINQNIYEKINPKTQKFVQNYQGCK